MFNILLILIFIRPFISSLAFPLANLTYSILLIGFLFVWIIRKGILINQSEDIKYPFILFVTALLISLVFSQDKITSIKEMYKYALGVLLFAIIASLSLNNKARIIKCLALTGFIIGLIAIYQYFFGFRNVLSYINRQGAPLDSFALDYISRRRVFYPFVTPNILGGYLAMVLIIALSYRRKIWIILPIFTALLLTKSLGALISLFIGLTLYFYLEGRLDKKKIIFLFAVLFIIFLVFASRAITQRQHTQPIFSTVMRLNYWRDTIRIIKSHPLTGVGPGNFNLITSRYAHNSYLQIWAEMGILGIISILWLAIASIKASLKNLKIENIKTVTAALISANIVFLSHNLLDFTFFLPEVSYLWWIILGLAITINPT